jgi:hypothetical protein
MALVAGGWSTEGVDGGGWRERSPGADGHSRAVFIGLDWKSHGIQDNHGASTRLSPGTGPRSGLALEAANYRHHLLTAGFTTNDSNLFRNDSRRQLKVLSMSHRIL